MREYAKVAPQFWTRGSGKRLRGDSDAQVLALYLVTSPCANMIGIYYVPWVAVLHETGLGEERASSAMSRLRASGFADYDDEAELAWVPNMASYQIGEKVKPTDNRHRAVRSELERVGEHRFAAMFVERYGKSYSVGLPPREGPCDHMFLDPLRRGVEPSEHPFEGVSAALGRAGAGAGAKQESESESAPELDSESEVSNSPTGHAAESAPEVGDATAPGQATMAHSRPLPPPPATLAAPDPNSPRKTHPGAIPDSDDPRGPVDTDHPLPEWAKARYDTYAMSKGLSLDVSAQWSKYLSHISDRRQLGEARPIGVGSWNKWLLDAPRFNRDRPGGQFAPTKAIAPERRILKPEERPTKPTEGSLLDYLNEDSEVTS